MAVDKRINYEIQGGVKNYRPSKMVTVPKIAKSSPDTPTAKLAYITPEEEKILIDLNLYGSLKGKPNRGPGGIPSLEGDFGGPGGFGGFQGGGDYSSAETGNSSGFDGTGSGPDLPPEVNRTPSQEAQDIRSAAINAGAGQRVNPGFFDSRNTISPAELAMAKAYRQDPTNTFARGAYKNTRGGGLGSFISGGGLLGGIIRNVGRSLGFGKNYNEPTYNMSNFNSLGLQANRFPSGFGIPNFESGDGDYDMLGNKINEITGEIISPTGESLGFIPGYPGSNTGGITNIISNAGDGNNYVPMLIPEDSTMPEDEELLGGFKSRFLQNRTQEEREAIEKMINEKFNYKYGNFGLGEYDGS